MAPPIAAPAAPPPAPPAATPAGCAPGSFVIGSGLLSGMGSNPFLLFLRFGSSVFTSSSCMTLEFFLGTLPPFHKTNNQILLGMYAGQVLLSIELVITSC